MIFILFFANSASYANENSEVLPNHPDYFVITDPIGIVFGIYTLGVGINKGQSDFTLAYSYLNTDIPEQNNLKGSAYGIRWDYYFNDLANKPYMGLAISYSDIEEKDDLIIKKE